MDNYHPYLYEFTKRRFSYLHAPYTNLPSDSALEQMGLQGWGILRNLVPRNLLLMLQDKWLTYLKNGKWVRLSGGGLMYEDEKGNILSKEVLFPPPKEPVGCKSKKKKQKVAETRRKEWSDLLEFAHTVLAPIFAKLGWVDTGGERRGWRYRVAGGTYLLYLDQCFPQSWHLDSPDPNCISVLLPLTENCPITDFATPEHQPRRAMFDIMKQAGWDRWPPNTDDIRAHFKNLSKDKSDEILEDYRNTFVENTNFRGQNYKVDDSCDGIVRPGDVIFFHSFTCHRAKAHLASMDPRCVFFFQMQFTPDDHGTYSADDQIYLGPTTVAISECYYSYLDECLVCMLNMGQSKSLLHNLAWHFKKEEEEEFLQKEDSLDEWLLLFFWYIVLKRFPEDLCLFLPNWMDIPQNWKFEVNSGSEFFSSHCISNRKYCPCSSYLNLSSGVLYEYSKYVTSDNYNSKSSDPPPHCVRAFRDICLEPFSKTERRSTRSKSSKNSESSFKLNKIQNQSKKRKAKFNSNKSSSSKKKK